MSNLSVSTEILEKELKKSDMKRLRIYSDSLPRQGAARERGVVSPVAPRTLFSKREKATSKRAKKREKRTTAAIKPVNKE